MRLDSPWVTWGIVEMNWSGDSTDLLWQLDWQHYGTLRLLCAQWDSTKDKSRIIIFQASDLHSIWQNDMKSCIIYKSLIFEIDQPGHCVLKKGERVSHPSPVWEDALVVGWKNPFALISNNRPHIKQRPFVGGVTFFKAPGFKWVTKAMGVEKQGLLF